MLAAKQTVGGTSAKELWLTAEGRCIRASESDVAPNEDLQCPGAGVNVCGEWGNLIGVGRLDL